MAISCTQNSLSPAREGNTMRLSEVQNRGGLLRAAVAMSLVVMNIAARFLASLVLVVALASSAPAQQAPAQRPPSRDGFPAGPTAQILSFTSSATSIQPGQSVTLEWTVVNADRITLDRGIGIVAARGSRTVKPSVTTTYTLTALGFGATGNDTRSVTVTVAGTTPAPAESPAASDANKP